MANIQRLVVGFAIALTNSVWNVSIAQTSPAAAAAAAGTSTTANGGTGGVGLGGAGPAVSARPDAAGGAGSSDIAKPAGNGALVGPRARKEADALMSENPLLQEQAPRNTGQRALMLDREQRPASPPQPAK